MQRIFWKYGKKEGLRYIPFLIIQRNGSILDFCSLITHKKQMGL